MHRMIRVINNILHILILLMKNQEFLGKFYICPVHSVCYSTDLLPKIPQTLKQILFLCLHGFVLIQKFGRRHLNINVFSLCKRSSKSYRIRLIVVGVKLRVRANYRCTPAVYKMSRNDPKLGSKMVAFS